MVIESMLQGTSFVLTHGAGGNRDAPLLLAVERELARAGAQVLRYNLPFRQKRPFGPPSPAGAAADRAGLAEAVAGMPGRLILAGHSYGGRQASMLAAEQPGLVEALVLLSYPLHPPNKPEQLRTAHLPQLRTPALFVHGTADPFGTVEEMRHALKLIPARTELLVREAAGHDLKVRGGYRFEDLVERIGSVL